MTPAIIFIRVDLPAPFSPNNACTSPFATSSEAPSRALVAPNAFLTSLSSSRLIGGTLPQPFANKAAIIEGNQSKDPFDSKDRRLRFFIARICNSFATEMALSVTSVVDHIRNRFSAPSLARSTRHTDQAEYGKCEQRWNEKKGKIL